MAQALPATRRGALPAPDWRPIPPHHAGPVALPALLGAEAGWLDLGGGAPVRVVRFRYDVEAAPTDFALAGLDCPAAIARCVPRRRQDFLFGRLAARASLVGVSGGRPPAAVGVGATREPLWPPGVIGSISHSGGVAVATAELAGGRRGIGIDIEREISARQYRSFDGIVMDLAEAALIERMADGGWPVLALATAVFSAKEAFYKAVWPAVRRTLDFADLRLVRADTDAGELGFAAATDLSPALPRGDAHRVRIARLDSGFVLTCCAWSA